MIRVRVQNKSSLMCGQINMNDIADPVCTIPVSYAAIGCALILAVILTLVSYIVYLLHAQEASKKPAELPAREKETPNLHVFWHQDGQLQETVNLIRAKPSYTIVSCVFHPLCGHSKQFAQPFAKLAKELQTTLPDAAVLKVFPENPGVLMELFKNVEIQGYPTVFMESRSSPKGDVFHDIYSPDSNELKFRTPESMNLWILGDGGKKNTGAPSADTTSTAS